ncbi:molybdenum cofactor biosynthesis protein MoaE [Corynebacterium nasicanis]|uniref:Molybdenum cofactor biosynthesis protein MoaE n=1 Tax=Corynebacterium nasicanis TaxID=1448267 RepID=A0ABW1QEV7_9CORY
MSTDPSYVATQTHQVIGAHLTHHPLEALLAEARLETMTDAMGALVVFEGIVRDHDGGEQVRALTYTAHPSAQEVLTAVAQGVVDKHREVRLWTAHRTGDLQIGDLAFAVAVASAHRAAAFAAAAELADRVKAEVPIWKEQELLHGPSRWVGLE